MIEHEKVFDNSEYTKSLVIRELSLVSFVILKKNYRIFLLFASYSVLLVFQLEFNAAKINIKLLTLDNYF